MITPASPRTFAQKLGKSIRGLRVKTVTLTPKGTGVKDGVP